MWTTFFPNCVPCVDRLVRDTNIVFLFVTARLSYPANDPQKWLIKQTTDWPGLMLLLLQLYGIQAWQKDSPQKRERGHFFTREKKEKENFFWPDSWPNRKCQKQLGKGGEKKVKREKNNFLFLVSLFACHRNTCGLPRTYKLCWIIGSTVFWQRCMQWRIVYQLG